MLSTVFVPKRDEVTGEWRKLHNEELSDLYSLSSGVPRGGGVGVLKLTPKGAEYSICA